jgi:hypothetical protein
MKMFETKVVSDFTVIILIYHMAYFSLRLRLRCVCARQNDDEARSKKENFLPAMHEEES